MHLVQYFDRIPVARITYTVLVETLNHAQSINQSIRIHVVSVSVAADYSCALQKDILVQGRLYISPEFVCFYANIFRWETVVCSVLFLC